MALGQQAAGRVDHYLATVGVVAIHDELLGAADRAEAQAFVGQQFVVGEAVMQFADADFFRADAGFLVHLVGGLAGHADADDADQRRRIEGFRLVGDQGLGEDGHVGAQAVLLREGFGHDDRSGGAAGRRAGHQAGHHAGEDHLVGHHVFSGDDLLEYRQRVVGGMAAGLGADRREGLHAGAVLLHVLLAGATEELQRVGHADAFREDTVSHFVALAVGDRTVGPVRLQGARLHLLEAEGQGAIDDTCLYSLARQVQRSRAAAAVVVDVDHRDPGQADFVQRRLAAGGVAIYVARVGLLHELVVDAGILQRQADRLGTHLDVGTALAGLGERDHADAGNVGFLRHHFLHGRLTGLRLSRSARGDRHNSWIHGYAAQRTRHPPTPASPPPPVEGDTASRRKPTSPRA
ncbi:hypothetical protein D9M71_327450 [compost metagenome]